MAQVNEVLPLESEHWGLEDYSVEVRGFECLHFSELNQLLKEDDEVWCVSQIVFFARDFIQVHADFLAYDLYKLKIYVSGKYLDDIRSPPMAGI